MHDLSESRNRRILVIDDNDAIHRDFRKILTSERDRRAVEDSSVAFFGEELATPGSSFKTDSAFQGHEGLEMVHQSIQKGLPYAMAFVDVRMPPGWDGVETIIQLWKADPDLLVVICTAYNDYNWSDMARQLGSIDRWLILKKPFDNVEVMQLAAALGEKWVLTQQARLTMSELEQIVKARTFELRAEIVERKECERKLVEAKERLRYQATHDPMTGLWSRAAISDILVKELARSKRNHIPLGLMFADIDHFKRINDEHGHAAGDTVLCGVAKSLKDSFRTYDELGRFGGEEFLVVLPEATIDEVFNACERARRQIEKQAYWMGDNNLAVTISMGVTAFDGDHDMDAKELIRCADDALYQAKRTGRNRIASSKDAVQNLAPNCIG